MGCGELEPWKVKTMDKSGTNARAPHCARAGVELRTRPAPPRRFIGRLREVGKVGVTENNQVNNK